MSKNRSNNLSGIDGDFPDSNDPRETEKFIRALEADDPNADSMSAEDREVYRLGAAIRLAAQLDLPVSNESLREQLIAKLDHNSFSNTQSKAESQMSDRPFSRFALAACLLLSLGLIAIVFALNQANREVGMRTGTVLDRGIEPDNGAEPIDRLADNPDSSIGVYPQVGGEVIDEKMTKLEVAAAEVSGEPGFSAESKKAFFGKFIGRLEPSGTIDLKVMEKRAEENTENFDSFQSNQNEVDTSDEQQLQAQVAKQIRDGLRGGRRGQLGGSAGSEAEQEYGQNGKTKSGLRMGVSGEIGGLGGQGGGIGGLGGQGDGGLGGGFGGDGGGVDIGGGGFDGVVGGVEIDSGAGRGKRELNDGWSDDGHGRSRVTTRSGQLHARESNNEQYDPIVDNEFRSVKGNQALSTFSIDVDTAAYANMRRFLLAGQRPPRNSIRIEELVNYFNYDYPQPEGDRPFAVDMEIASCPWNDQHHLLRVALKGKAVHRNERSPSNLVFLLDVSGSMQSEDKLPLLKQGLTMMVQQLSENDSISIVTYSGNAGVVLNPTNGNSKRQIEIAIEQLSAGGSTNGSAGIELAYGLAQKQFINTGSNRVILATDGDLNVGVTDDNALVQLIREKASEGVFLTVLGFGTGNLKDSKLEKLADNGNGMYAYIDSVREAHKVLIEQMSGSLETIAKDVKIQIEFNPTEVAGYRLIGYENRVLAAHDFENDRKDAGEIGAGHSVTALYELVLKGVSQNVDATQESLKYQTSEPAGLDKKEADVSNDAKHAGELLTLALRYKKPDGQQSERIEFTLDDEPKSFSSSSGEFRFAASVASFGMILRDSRYRGNTNLKWVEETASRSLGDDVGGYRSEFLALVRQAALAR